MTAKLRARRAHTMINAAEGVAFDLREQMKQGKAVDHHTVRVQVREALKQDPVLRSYPPTADELSLLTNRVWREVRP